MSNAIVLNDLLHDGRHFARKTPQGAVEIIDSLSGKVVAVIRDPLAPPLLEKRTLPNGEEVWVSADVPEHVLPHVGRNVVPYHPWILDQICEKIAEGGSLTRICREPGMPSYSLLSRWRRRHPEVEEALEKARRDRAEFLRDQAMEEALAADEDTVGSQRLKHEALKWGAGVDDAKYSPKAKVEATINAPTAILVKTGIDRDVTPPETLERGEIHGENQVQSVLLGTTDGGSGGSETADVDGGEGVPLPDPS